MQALKTLMVTLLLLLLTFPARVPAQDTPPADAPRRLEPVVVTATKVDTPPDQLGAAVTVITEEELNAYNYTRIEEALRTVPGVEMRRSGSVGKSTTIRIRGANPNQVQVLVDGLRVKSPTLGSADLSEYPLDAIERIEIVRGPQSTLYGSDAMGGVVNIITKKGTGPPRATLLTEVGTYQTFRHQVTTSGALKGLGYALSASRLDSDGQLDNDDLEQSTAAARFDYRLPWKADVTVSLRYTKLALDVPIDRAPPVVFDPNAQQQTETWLYNLTYQQTPVSWWDVKVRHGHWWNNQGSQDPPGPSGAVFASEGDDVSTNAFANPVQQINTRRREFELVNTLRLATWNVLTLGAEHQQERGYNRSRCSPRLAIEPAPPSSECNRGSYTIRQTFNTVSGFVQDEVSIVDRVILSGGLRYDDHDTFGDELTPRVAAVVKIKETDTKLRGTWGIGFRAPTINDFLLPAFGSPSVKPERSESYDFGVDQRLWKGIVRFGATAFHNEFRDRIRFVCNPSFTVCTAGNQSGARTLGLETYAEADPLSWLNTYVNYTYTRSRANDARELTSVPRNIWNLGVNLRPTDALGLFMQAHVQSSDFQGNFNGRKPGYHRLDAGGSYRVFGRAGIMERMDVTARVENFTDEAYQETLGFGAPGFTATLGLKVTLR